MQRDARIRGSAEAYRLSLEGWRRLERGALAATPTARCRARSRSIPSDPVIRYRHAAAAGRAGTTPTGRSRNSDR